MVLFYTAVGRDGDREYEETHANRMTMLIDFPLGRPLPSYLPEGRGGKSPFALVPESFARLIITGAVPDASRGEPGAATNEN